MKRAFALIGATLLATSIYSQTDPYPTGEPDYQSRQTEAGAPATSSQSESYSSGYEREQGVSGGNSSTGQSTGENRDNLGSVKDQDQTIQTGSSITRDRDLSDVRGPSNASSIQGDLSQDSVFPDEEWNLYHPDMSVGAPANSENGEGSSSSSVDRFDQPNWNVNPTFRDQSDDSERFGTDIPAGPADYDQSLDETQTYNDSTSSGAPATSASGSGSSVKKDHCDTDKSAKGSAPDTVQGSGSAKDSDEVYRLNRNDSDDHSRINRDDSSDSSLTPDL